MFLLPTDMYKENKKVKISMKNSSGWSISYVQYFESHIREDTRIPRVLPYTEWLAIMLIDGAAGIILYALILYFICEKGRAKQFHATVVSL